MHRTWVLLTLLLFSSTGAFSQQTQKEDGDSLVRLLSASRALLVEDGGRSFRRVEGDVAFLHNDTYLYCDTAFWCVEEDYIDALGHVQVVQENAVLSSDRLHYDIRESLATFRGSLVQLEDRDSSILRTSDLDYNTRDSVAFFRGGASMKDSNGSIIESMDGKYESALKRFTFTDHVEMYSDSVFFTCDELRYESETDKATFIGDTKGWSGRNHIRSCGGWYEKPQERVFFDGGVYMQTESYEAWCRHLLYERGTQNVKMFRDVEVLDTVHNVMATGGFLDYYNDPRKVLLTDDPSLIGVQKGSSREDADTLFLRADTLVYEVVRKYMVPGEAARALERLQNLEADAVTNKKANDASDAAAQAASEAKTIRGRRGAGPPPPGDTEASAGADVPRQEDVAGIEVRDTLSREEFMAQACDSLSKADSLFIFDSEVYPDSLMLAAMDSVVRNWKDTTQVTFLHGCHDVRMYRQNMQMVADSLEYSTLDSIARLYVRPMVWKDVTTQLSADSMQFVIRGGTVDRGIMMSDAMIVAEQTPGRFYNQIKSPEMTGFFTGDGSSLRRFDAIGGVQALFFMEEDSVVTTMNQKETKIMSATFANGSLKRVLYMDGVKSDVYPVWDLWKSDRDKLKLKGFLWSPEKRPADRYAITSRTVKPSVRHAVRGERQFPLFTYTSAYFPGYMEGIFDSINEREPLIWLPRETSPSERRISQNIESKKEN